MDGAGKQPRGGSARGPKSAYLVGLFGLLLILMSWAGSLFLIEHDRDKEIQRIQGENAFMARAFEEHARRIITAADSALLFMKEEVERHRGIPEELQSFAAMTRRDLPAVQVAISDPKGTLLYSAVPLKSPLNISEREHFKVHAADAAVGLFIGKPVLTKATATWSYFLSRRIDNADGSFGGIVSVGLDPFYFGNVYENLSPGEGRTAMIVGTDHIVRVRIDNKIKTVGDDISGYSPVFREAAQQPVGHYEVHSPLSNTNRYAGYRLMPDYPLIVISSISKAQAMADFSFRRELHLWAAALFSVFVGGFCWLLIRADRLVKRQNVRLTEELEERRRAETALAASEKRFRELARMLPEIVFELNEKGDVVFVNEQAFRTSPLSEAEVAARVSAESFLAPQDRERGFGTIRRVLEGGVQQEFDFTMLRKDGSAYPAVLLASPLIEDGRIAGVRGLIVDMSRIKEAEAKLVQAQKMESLGVMAGGIAHDFNNILQAIFGFIQLVQNSGELGARNAAWLAKAADSCDRAAELVQGLLTFSRKRSFEFKPFDLNAEVGNAVAILERTLPKTLRIELSLDEGQLCIQGDPVQLEHVFFNLASNASDATDGRGTIRIASGRIRVEQPDEHLPLAPGEWAHVAFSDDGAGIDENALESIFDPFFTTKEVGKGTGLGLSIVYGLVQEHGGKVFCRSRKGEGAVFDLYFPLRPEACAAVEPREPAADRWNLGRKPTLLLVDDNEAILDSLSATLNNLGVVVLTARSGEEALEVYRQHGASIELVVLDVGMPGMGGLKCFVRLREIHPECKVVISTGYALPTPPVDGRGRPADALVPKPYRFLDLMAHIRKLVE